MRDILLAIVIGLYALWGYTMLKKIDMYFSEEKTENYENDLIEEENIGIVGRLQHWILGWTMFPRLSKVLFRFLMRF